MNAKTFGALAVLLATSLTLFAPAVAADGETDAAAANANSKDCVPRLVQGPGGSLFLVCSTAYACGINATPICWTVRFACMNALNAVFHWYQETFNKGGQCEGNGGWP
jgi:hypothetical protein